MLQTIRSKQTLKLKLKLKVSHKQTKLLWHWVKFKSILNFFSWWQTNIFGTQTTTNSLTRKTKTTAENLKETTTKKLYNSLLLFCLNIVRKQKLQQQQYFSTIFLLVDKLFERKLMSINKTRNAEIYKIPNWILRQIKLWTSS